MEVGPSSKELYSSAEAVMLGALAPGVNVSCRNRACFSRTSNARDGLRAQTRNTSNTVTATRTSFLLRLNLYIYDHLVKRNMHITAESFAKEADLHPEYFVVPPVEGFLSDWWCLFWDVYSARLNLRQAAQASSSQDNQTTQDAGSVPQNVHPVLPLSWPDENFILHNTSPAMQMLDYGNLLLTVRPTTIPRPDIEILLQNSVSILQSTTPRLDMRNLLQNALPMMPLTEFNPVTSITHINMVQMQTETNLIAARVFEKMCLRPPARDIYSNSSLTNVNQLAPVLASSSSSSSAIGSCSQPQKRNNNKRNFSVTIDDNFGTGLTGSTSVELILPTPARSLVQHNIEHADTGSSTSSNSTCPTPNTRT